MSHAVAGESSAAEPNLTPLLDVVLQLLMFFMMCVNFVNEQINEEIRLPKSQVVKPTKADTDLLFVNVKPFTLADFQDRLPADVLARVQDKFREGDECILVSGKEPMKRAELRVWLKQEYEDKKLASGNNQVNTAIVIRAHKDADYGQVYDILDLCKNVGFRRMSLRALSKTQPGGAQ
jgi:biopolymer transport protein ExbD